MTYYVGNMPVGDDELMHYGTKGMRWGQRRFQNRDGSLTAAGRLRYGWGRAKRGAGRAYGQARRTAKRTYKKASNWYQRNKKTIGKVALGAGAVGLAAVGARYGKNIARVARNIPYNVRTGVRTAAARRRTPRLEAVARSTAFAKNSRLRRAFGNVASGFGGKASAAGNAFKRTAGNVRYKAKTAASEFSRRRKTPRLVSNTQGIGRDSKARRIYGKATSAIGGAARKAGNTIGGKANHIRYKAKTAVNESIRRRKTPRLVANTQAAAKNSRARRIYGQARDTVSNTARKVGGTVRDRANHAKYVVTSRAKEASRRRKTPRIEATARSHAMKPNSRARNAYEEVKRRARNAKGTAGYYKAKVENTVRNARGAKGGYKSSKAYKAKHPESPYARQARRVRNAAIAGTAAGYAVRAGNSYATYKNARKRGRSKANAGIGAAASALGGFNGWAAYRVGDAIGTAGARYYRARKRSRKKSKK